MKRRKILRNKKKLTDKQKDKIFIDALDSKEGIEALAEAIVYPFGRTKSITFDECCFYDSELKKEQAKWMKEFPEMEDEIDDHFDELRDKIIK